MKKIYVLSFIIICNFCYSQNDYKLKLNAKSNFEFKSNNIKNPKIKGKGYILLDVLFTEKVDYFKIRALHLNNKTLYWDEVFDYENFQLLYKEIYKNLDKNFVGRMIETKTLYRAAIIIHINNQKL